MTTDIAIKEPMRLTAGNVDAIFSDCLTNARDFIIHGVVISAYFDRKKVDAHEEQIMQMLMQLPTEFHSPTGGGGWTFLNMCIDKDGTLWTEFHQMQDKLVCLGRAIGALDYVLPRDLWQVLPGGMPYIVIKDNYKEA